MLDGIVERAAMGLGAGAGVEAELYKLLVYDEGSFFLEHRDTEKSPGMFGTLIVALPSLHAGGELVIRHRGREARLDLRCADVSELAWAAFYADCVHEVLPITRGAGWCSSTTCGARAAAACPARRRTTRRQLRWALVASVVRTSRRDRRGPAAQVGLPAGSRLHAGRAVVCCAQGRRCCGCHRADRGRGRCRLRSTRGAAAHRREWCGGVQRLLRPTLAQPLPRR